MGPTRKWSGRALMQWEVGQLMAVVGLVNDTEKVLGFPKVLRVYSWLWSPGVVGAWVKQHPVVGWKVVCYSHSSRPNLMNQEWRRSLSSILTFNFCGSDMANARSQNLFCLVLGGSPFLEWHDDMLPPCRRLPWSDTSLGCWEAFDLYRCDALCWSCVPLVRSS